MNTTILCLSIMLATSCVNQSGEQEYKDTYNRRQFFEIDYEEILERKALANLSDLASSVEYVALETQNECLVKSVVQYRFTEDFIFVANVDHVLMFDRKGGFIRKIGKPGRGPGEIGGIRYLSVLEKERQVVVQTNWARKLYYFSFEGEFLYSAESPDVENIKVLSNGNQLIYNSPTRGTEKYLFVLKDSSGDTLSVVYNHYLWENRSRFSSMVYYHLYTPFYDYKDLTSMKYIYSDTVYLNSGDSIVPEYIINMGRYKLKDKDRAESLQGDFRIYLEVSKGYRFAVPFEARGKLFISSMDFFSDIKEEIQWNMIFDRRSGSGNLIVNNQGEPGLITNNIDGGPDFWPKGSINDSVVYMPLLSHTLIGEENMNHYIDKEAIDAEKKRDFLKLAGTTNENSNPVLMIVKLRQESVAGMPVK